MTEHVTAEHDLIGTYGAYSDLMAAIGHEVDEAALAQHLSDRARQRKGLEGLLTGQLEADEVAPPIDEELTGRMRNIQKSLVAEIGRVACEWIEGDPAAMTLKAIVGALKAAPEERRDAIADALVLNGHRQFLRPRYTTPERLRQSLVADQGSAQVDVDRLVVYLQEELQKRGYAMSEGEVQGLIDGGQAPSQVPHCLAYILRRAKGRFQAGLIPLAEMVGDQDPDTWLEAARSKLQFRSHSAMHKALAEATSLKYDCVHKALSGRQKAKRIQAEIKCCLAQWLESVQAGQEPDIGDEHRGVPVEQTQNLLPELEKKFRTKEEIYRVISQKTGIKTGSVRRYFQSNGQLKYAPLIVYRWAEKLAHGNGSIHAPRSYLADRRTRAAAFELARRAEEALQRWHDMDDDPDLELAYRELRRALIVCMKERRQRVPAAL